ncbi:MAG: AAA family ATPase [Patescibacteria group bacterium]
MLDGIIGHQKILNYFDKVIAAGNLSHAYCFVGPAQVGKCTVAKMLSARLLRVEPDRLNTQADFVEIKQGIDEKTGKTKKDISIEQLRDCQSFFSEYSFLGGYKIVIIDPADKMSLAAANALLKTLEEPRQKTLIFLLTVDEKKLPQTIYSRCQMVYFSPVPNNEIIQALDGIGRDRIEEIASLSRGLPGQAIVWAEDKEIYESYKKEAARFESLSGTPFYDKIKKVEDLFGDKKDHIAAREKLKEAIGIWQLFLRDIFFASIGAGEYSIQESKKVKGLNKDLFLNLNSLIENAQRQLRQNVHPRLLVEQILLEMP